MNSLTTPTRLSRKWKCELELCVCVHECVYEGLGHGFVWVNISNWTMLLFSMTEDVWAGRGEEILQPCQYLLKQAECEYLVLPPPSGTCFSV